MAERYTLTDDHGRPLAGPALLERRRELRAKARRSRRFAAQMERQRAAAGVEYHPPQETILSRSVATPLVDPHDRAIEPPRLSREELLAIVGFGPPAQETLPALVACRVDWLTVAFKVALFAGKLEELAARLDGDQQTRAAVTIAEAPFELRRLPSGVFLLENASAVVRVDAKSADGWTVEVQFSGSRMMRMGVDLAVQLARGIAAYLGVEHGERVRRLDLSADFQRFDVNDVKPRAFVKPSRARLARCSPRDIEKEERLEQPELHQHRAGQDAAVTGYVVCPGNTMSAVIYNKREELLQHPEKRAAEEERWRAGGWDGFAPIARVELRFRTEALNDLGVRDGLDKFRLELDGLWSYGTCKWLRLVNFQTARRLARCKLDPIWAAVQRARFSHRASPLARHRVRAGAPACQVLGAAISTLARDHRMPPAHEAINEETGELLTEAQTTEQLDKAGARALVSERIGAIFQAAAAHVVDDVIARRGEKGAATFILYRENAARARFAVMAPRPPSRFALLALESSA